MWDNSKRPGRPIMAEYERNHRAGRMSALAMLKMEVGCADCGYNKTPVALQFDHVKGDKVMSVSMMAGKNASWEKLFAEIDKCQVRCANCHAERTWLPEAK